MKPYVTFSDDAILDGAALQERSLEGQTGVTIPRETKMAPTELSTEEKPSKELVPTEVSTEEVAPTEDPNEETNPTVVTTKEAAPTGEPIEGLTILAATVSKPAEGPDIPPVQHEEKGKGEVPHSDFPAWTKVLHPSQLVTAAGQTPLTPGELRWRHHSQSVGGRRAWHQRAEEC